MLWKTIVEVMVEINDFQYVHMRVKFPSLHDWIFFTGVYGSPQ